jgi:PAS domain S-box-containing protein
MVEKQIPVDNFSNFDTIFNNSQDAIINKTSEGDIINWNHAAERIFGYTADEIVGKNISIIIPNELKQEEDDIMQRIQHGERVEHYNSSRITKDKRTIPISITVSAVKDIDGNFIGTTIIARDITEQKFFSEKNAMLAAIVDSSDDAIIGKTLDGIITSWNKAAHKLFGYTENEVIGHHISLIIPQDRLQEEDELIASIRQSKKVEHYKTVRLTKVGLEIPISLTVSPILGVFGEVIGASKIARDISEQQTSEEKQAMLAAIVNSSEDAIISKTLNGIITSWNKAAHKLFGYTDKEAIGKHISLIIPTERLDEENTIISRIKEGLRVDHFETIRLKKDGGLIPISLSISPIKDYSGKITGASKIARDITEEIDNREKIKLYYDQLEKINSYKDEFIGLASHELKTPLTSITGYLQLLESTLKDEKPKIFVKRAVNQARKLSSLVSDLLDMSKIQTGNLTLNLGVFDFNDLLDETIITIDDTVATHELELIRPNNQIIINGDKQRIEQVLINLVNNAVKYSPKADKVIMTVTDTDDNIKVAVKDFGIGIAKNQQKKIFSRFYRVDDINPSISGLGIGLYISYDIVTKHNGRIWVDSEPGNGSTFYFEIPKQS